MLAVSMCVVAVIGASVTLGVLREFGVSPKSDLDIAVQSLQKGSETRFRAVSRNGPTNAPDMAPISAPTAEPPSRDTIAGLDGPALTNPFTPEEIADLVKRGRELIAAGKITDARPLLRSAADAGDATAAFVLATTYDPVELGKLGARDADPDIAMAGAWYQKAKDLGSAGGNR
jgi:TPR repeat protein